MKDFETVCVIRFIVLPYPKKKKKIVVCKLCSLSIKLWTQNGTTNKVCVYPKHSPSKHWIDYQNSNKKKLHWNLIAKIAFSSSSFGWSTLRSQLKRKKIYWLTIMNPFKRIKWWNVRSWSWVHFRLLFSPLDLTVFWVSFKSHCLTIHEMDPFQMESILILTVFTCMWECQSSALWNAQMSFLDMGHSARKAMLLLVELLWTHQENKDNYRKEWQKYWKLHE